MMAGTSPGAIGGLTGCAAVSDLRLDTTGRSFQIGRWIDRSIDVKSWAAVTRDWQPGIRSAYAAQSVPADAGDAQKLRGRVYAGPHDWVLCAKQEIGLHFGQGCGHQGHVQGD